MNERIQELERQATDYYSNGQERIFDRQKFAELIVRECLDIAQDRANFPGFPPNDVNHIINEIKEHFRS
jgi:hypothetical protein